MPPSTTSGCIVVGATLTIKSNIIKPDGKLDVKKLNKAITEGTEAMVKVIHTGIKDEAVALGIDWTGMFVESIKITKLSDTEYEISSDARSMIGGFPYADVIEDGFTKADQDKFIYFDSAPDLRGYLRSKGWSEPPGGGTKYLIAPSGKKIGRIKLSSIIKVGRAPFAKGFHKSLPDAELALKVKVEDVMENG